MPRDAQAYLSDILESCDAIVLAVHGLDLDGYRSNRLVRSSVERVHHHRRGHDHTGTHGTCGVRVDNSSAADR